MLRYLEIANFKSLKDIRLPLEKLNLFFGLNCAGKSSVLQSLLLLRQSYFYRNEESLAKLMLNAHLLRLGTSRDVLCQTADTDQIKFYLKFENGKFLNLAYTCSESGADSSLPLEVTSEGKAKNFPSLLSMLEGEPLFGHSFCYLAAEHIGPRRLYDMTKMSLDAVDVLGTHGEYAVPYLAINGDNFHVPARLCLTEGKTDSLMDQVSAWMSKISPGIRLRAETVEYEKNAKLLVSYDGNRLLTTDFSPVNVGFGIPYALPLIVEILISNKNSLLLIENPESHLHPNGQTWMAELIARAAANGAQILCESHSDHLINGVRVAVKEETLQADDVTVAYFDKNDDQETFIEEIQIDSNGTLDKYPKGLLDEWGNLLSKLI